MSRFALRRLRRSRASARRSRARSHGTSVAPARDHVTTRFASLFLLLALSACAPGSNDSGAGPSGNAGSSGTAGAGPGIPGTGTAGTSGTAGGGGSAPPLPPEVEVESSFEVPVATGHFIWVANPQSGRVAYVDASTLEVHTVEAGNAPTYMSPIPGNVDAVIVLNVLSDDATVLSVGTAGLESRTIGGVAHGANALAVSANGGWAIAWTDARRVKNAAANDGYQDLTVINLDRRRPSRRPSSPPASGRCRSLSPLTAGRRSP